MHQSLFQFATNVKFFNVENTYTADKEIEIRIQHLIYHQLFDKIILSSLPTQFLIVISNNALGIVENRLVFYEPVLININKVFRIIIPLTLRHTIFYLLRTSSVADHMGEYKTLYRFKLSLSWPKIRSEIHQWIKQYPHCQLTFQ